LAVKSAPSIGFRNERWTAFGCTIYGKMNPGILELSPEYLMLNLIKG
jgi:hypothetical protein